MPAAVPLIAVVAAGIASAAVGGGIIGAVVGAGAAFIVSAIGQSVFPQKPASLTSGFDAGRSGAGRTQAFRQPITEHQLVVGRCKVSGPIVFLHSASDDEGRVDGYFYSVVVLAAHRVRAIGEVYLGDKAESDGSLAGLARIDRHLGDPNQAADANLIAETGGQWTSEHRGRGRAYVAVRLKLTAEAFPSGPPNIAAIVEGADTILDPRTGIVGWSDNPALLLGWYLTAPFGWRASWSDIDIPALMAAANICDELVGTRAGVYERRYTANGVLSLAEGKIAITRKLAAAMAGALVVSGGRFFIHAGAAMNLRENLAGDALASITTLQWNAPAKAWIGGAAMADASLNKRMTVRLGLGTALAQIGIVGLDGAIELEALRLYGLPEAAPALLCGTPALPIGQREFAAEVAWDLPSLAPGTTSLLDVTVNGARQGDLARTVLATSTRFIELDATAWSNNTIRVMARNISPAAFDLSSAMLSAAVTKRRVP